MPSTVSAASGSALREHVHDAVDDDLRAVIAYSESGSIEYVYLRPGLDYQLEQEGTEARDDILEELLVESLAKSTSEDSFDLGSLNCAVRFFDDATVVHCIVSEGAGVAFSLEPGTLLANQSLLDDCLEIVGVDAPASTE
ncbi:hypothetical protein [Halogranum rubrum]|uniref:hypothetical protein n=1 Tax=Halogranum rubrum TaxID=553466 RepID=UPI0012FC34F4|nr:hypothetical protein [Halogranum salarium]